MKRKRIFALDWVRMIATVAIIVFHYNVSCLDMEVGTEPILFWSYANGSLGHIGTTLFFVLSGASLMYSCGEQPDWRGYYKKRFLAIYPLYWMVYAAFFVYTYMIKRLPMPQPLSSLILSVLGMDGYLSEYMPTCYLVGEWFVGCIVLIYLIFPLLYRLVERYPAAAAAGTLLLFLPYLLWCPFEGNIEHIFLTRIPEVMGGMYLTRYIFKTDGTGKVGGKPALAALAAALVILFIPLPGVPVPYLTLILGLSLFILLSWTAQRIEDTRTGKLLQYPVQRYAACSFSVFLVHHILIGRFTLPLSGTTITPWENRVTFLKYFLFISVIGYAFSLLHTLILRLCAALAKHET